MPRPSPTGPRDRSIFEVLRRRHDGEVLDELEVEAVRVRIGRAITAGTLATMREGLVDEAARALEELALMPHPSSTAYATVPAAATA